MKMRRLLFSLALAASLTLPAATPALAATNTTAKVTTQATHTAHTGLNEIHSQAEIRQKLNAKDAVQLNEKIVYTKKPTYHKPYSLDQIGEVSKKTQEDAVEQINQYRWLAGLGKDRMVTLNTEDVQNCQAGAYYLSIIQKVVHLSHDPNRISDVTDELYEKAYIGTSASKNYLGNVGSENNCVDISGYILDFPSLTPGHRFAMLNQYGVAASCGWASKGDATYDACRIKTDYKTVKPMQNAGVAWPAYNTPLEYFFGSYDDAEMVESGEEDPESFNGYTWSFSCGNTIDESKRSNIQVVFTNNQTGKKTVYSKATNSSRFNINGDAVIWQPDTIYKSGYSFHVTITGLDYPVDYDVNFFRLRTQGTNKPSDQTSGTKESGSKAAAAKLKSRTVKKPQTKKTSYKSGKTFQLSKRLISGSDETYASSDKKIATVSKSGKVTIKKPGYVKISVKSRKTKTYKAASTSVKLYVYPGKVKSVKVKRSGRHGCKVSWKTAKSLYSDVDIVCAASKRKLKRMTKHASRFAPCGDQYNAKIKKAAYRSRKSKRRTYYFCVRSCKTSHGKELYGSWSKVYKVRF